MKILFPICLASNLMVSRRPATTGCRGLLGPLYSFSLHHFQNRRNHSRSRSLRDRRTKKSGKAWSFTIPMKKIYCFFGVNKYFDCTTSTAQTSTTRDNHHMRKIHKYHVSLCGFQQWCCQNEQNSRIGLLQRAHLQVSFR